MSNNYLPRLEIYLLGAPQVRCGGSDGGRHMPVKAQALLYYLAATGQTHTRAALAHLLWSEHGEAEARSNLRKGIQELREHFGAYLAIDHHSLGLVSPQIYWVDAAEFVAGAGQPCAADPDRLQAALDLYRADFLDGFHVRDAPEFEAWLLRERARLRELMVQGLAGLAEYRVAEGELAQAIACVRRLLELEPWREEAHRQLMTWLVHSGQRNAALLQYEVCRRVLADELGVEPEKATRDLHVQLLQSEAPVLLDSATDISRADWGEAPDESGFIGRHAELQQLCRWLVDERCRLVAVLGMGGIGKTVLATHASESVHGMFSAVIWRSLRNAPSFAELLKQCIQVLSNHEEIRLPATEDQWIALLMEHLRARRCLLIFDNFETILQADRPGHYLPGYEGYGQLLFRLAQGRHQSCLLLTSREKPRELISTAGDSGPVRTFHLAGLNREDSRVLLHDRGLGGSDLDWFALHARYSGNPLALQIVSETIRELFSGNINRFLTQETILFGEINDLLAQQVARLSSLEQELMFWLAIEREAVTADELQDDLVSQPPRYALLAALHALRQRCLVEHTDNGFTLQNVVLEYFTALLNDQVCEGLRNDNSDWLQRFALLKATAKAYVRESQRNLILGPIARRLVEDIGIAMVVEQFGGMLARLRRITPRQQGYTGGNILNLYVQLGIDLCGRDFSHLAVWQADLRNVVARNLDFRRADLSRSAFTETFAAIYSLAFSPDGERLASGTMGNEIRVWQVSDGKPVLNWVAHQGWVRSVCFSPDGSILASTGGDQMIRLWNARDGTLVTTLQGHSNDVLSVCFGPDGRILATGSVDQTVRIWDRYTGECLHVLQGHKNDVYCTRFSPDGSILASSGGDQTVRLWNPRSGTCIRVLRGHSGSVWSISFNVDGSILATAGDQTVRFWSPHSGECLRELYGHTNWVRSACFSPGGSLLASCGEQTVELWNWESGERLHIMSGHSDVVWSISFSPDEQILASGGIDQTVRLWDCRSGKCLHTLQGHANDVFSVCHSPKEDVLASGSDDRRVRLWDAHTGECLQDLLGHTKAVRSICFSPDGSTVASGGDDWTVRLWDPHCDQCLHVMQGHTNAIRFVCFSPGGSVLASASLDRTIRLWDSVTGRCIHVLKGHTNAVRSVCFSPDGGVLASGSGDQIVRLWDRNTGDCSGVLLGHENAVMTVCFDPTGRVLVSGSIDHTLRLWDSYTGECLHVLRGHTGWIWSACFSPAGNLLASASDDRTVRLWDTRSGECLHVFQGHANRVRSICISPDGNALVSGSSDGTIKIWNVNKGMCLRTLYSDRPYERMNIAGVTGLTLAQAAALEMLGAVQH